MKKLWKEGLGKTRKGLAGRLGSLFKGRSEMDESFMDDLEEILIESDVGVDAALALMKAVKDALSHWDGELGEGVRNALKAEVETLLPPVMDLEKDFAHKPHVILVVGVNGTGKTTTVGKLGLFYHRQGRKVLMAGADTFRAAAGEQLEVWARRADAAIVRQSHGADPASVAYDAVDAGIARDVDVVIVDTAGRLHNKTNLMEELKKIKRVIQKRLPDAPHEVLLVLDATTGQNGLSQARLFTEAVEVSHLALTKLDGTARGGIVLGIQRTLGLPVKWVGLGEGPEDLAPFDPAEFVEGLFADSQWS